MTEGSTSRRSAVDRPKEWEHHGQCFRTMYASTANTEKDARCDVTIFKTGTSDACTCC